MISRCEFERQKAKAFTLDLFWALESWIDSIKATTRREEPSNEREKIEEILRGGLSMRVSQLSLMVIQACRRQSVSSASVGEGQWEKVCLNESLRQLAEYSKTLLEAMGSSLTIPDSPEMVIWTEQETSGPLFTYIIWWVLDAWPDGQINVDLSADNEKVEIVFHDFNRVHIPREDKEGHKNLLVWSCIIEYLVTVEYHGRCIWPKAGEPRRLEIILPVHPPTTEELDAPPPEWMR